MLYRISTYLLVLCAPGLFGCQLLLELDSKQCERDVDCADMLGATYVCSNDTYLCVPDPALVDSGPPPLPKEWEPCLRDKLPTADSVVVDGSIETVRVGLATIDYTTHRTPNVTSARVCLASDFDCNNPYHEGVMMDEEGFLNFEMPFLFKGRIEVEAENRLPVLVYRNRPYDGDYRGFGVSTVAREEVASLGTRSDDEVQIDDAGLVIFEVRNCADDPAAGVTVARIGDSSDVPFYFDGPLPDQDLTATRIGTDLTHDGSPIAAGGFFNAKPGFATYEARLAETGDLVATFGIEVKAGHMALIKVEPGDY